MEIRCGKFQLINSDGNCRSCKLLTDGRMTGGIAYYDIKRLPYYVSKRYFLAIYLKSNAALKECLKYNYSMAPTEIKNTVLILIKTDQISCVEPCVVYRTVIY